MAIGDVYEATVHCSLGNQASVSRRYWRTYNEAGTGTTLTDVATRLGAQFGQQVKACMSSAATYHGTKVAKIWPNPRGAPTVNIAGAGAGGVAGDPCPRQVRGMITLTSAFAGRAYRGRIYVPFPAEASNDADATPTAAYLALLETLGDRLDDVQTDVGAGGNTAELRPILARITYTLPPIVQINVITVTIITGHIVRDKWATQRRSGDYGKPNTIGI